MLDFAPYEKGKDLVVYCSDLACTVHAGVSRDNGRPYKTHLEDMVESMNCVLKKSIFLPVALAATWLHDGPEDGENFDVYNPYAKKLSKMKDKVYLNDLLAQSGEQGKMVCHIVDQLTNRRTLRYFDYMQKLFSLPRSEPQRSLKMLSIAIKIMDRKSNTLPGERINLNEELEEYRRLHEDGASVEMYKQFYRQQKVMDTFTELGEFGYDSSLFYEAKRQRFQGKKICYAVDNLQLYIPGAEEILLLGLGKKGQYFNIEEARKNPLFDYDILRQKFKDCAHRSFEVMRERIPFKKGNHIYWIKKTGLNRDWKPPQGYTPILKEVKKEMMDKGSRTEEQKLLTAIINLLMSDSTPNDKIEQMLEMLDLTV